MSLDVGRPILAVARPSPKLSRMESKQGVIMHTIISLFLDGECGIPSSSQVLP